MQNFFTLIFFVCSFSVFAAVPSAPSAPIPSINGDNISVSWGSSASTNYYDLSIKYNSNNWTPPGRYKFNSTNTSWSGLPSGTRSYKVSACNNDGCSNYSGVSAAVTIYPIPGTPTTPNATVVNSDISVSWGGAAGATYYDVLIKYNDNNWTPPGRYKFNSTNTSWSGLPSGTRSYRVSACNTSGCSNYSGVSTAITIYPIPGTPTTPNATVVNSSISVNWRGSAGATYYDVSIKYNDNNWTPPGRYQFNSTSTSWNELPSGTRSYRVSACNTSGCSTYSGVSTAVTIVEVPSNLIPVVNGGDTSVSWNEALGATQYEVIIKFNDNDWTEPGRYITDTNSISWQDLPAGMRSYKVRACYESLSHCSAWSAPSDVVTILEVPSSLVPVVDGNDISVSWNEALGATQYEVIIKFNDNDWTEPGRYITDTNSISWQDL
ncbi:MAG: putative glyoxalase superfamily protein PhnB, partial [Alteromonadaceae bacterium]